MGEPVFGAPPLSGKEILDFGELYGKLFKEGGDRLLSRFI